jgi:hypothetical protein
MRRRAISSPAQQSEPSLAITTQVMALPLEASRHSEFAHREESDDNSSVATTTDADDHDTMAADTADRPEDQRDDSQHQDDGPEQETQRPASPHAEDTRQTHRQRDACLICVSAPRDAVCAPCGHLAACHACLLTAVQTFRVCPICRARVQCVMRIYDA